MENVLLVIHLLLVVALIGLVLLQKSEGGALGMGGGGNGVMSSRGAANALTRLTALCAAGFFITSLALAFIAGRGVQNKSILDRAAAPIEAPASTAPAKPQAPAVPLTSAPTPSAPISSAPTPAASAPAATPNVVAPVAPVAPSVPTTSVPAPKTTAPAPRP